MTKIKELFKKEITRRINPAVVVNELDEDCVNQEIEEYIFTTDISKHFYKYLDTISKKEHDKTGIWINGYYGSGKSHFIKYLYYCLSNKYKEKAQKLFIEYIKDQEDTLPEIDISMANIVFQKINNLQIEQIIFNIDVESAAKNDKNAITRILLNQLNKHRGFCDGNIALAHHLEKPLFEKGVFEKFKEDIKNELKVQWDGNQIKHTNRYLETVVRIAQRYDPKLDNTLIDSIKKDEQYRIADMVNEFNEFLEGKGDNYRLIFLIDEVSQYIDTSSSLLLNLQSIVEEIGNRCGGKIWITCTAQQELGGLIGTTEDRTLDFGKILARFETRISLQSQDASYITKRRVLEKTTTANNLLSDFFNKNKIAIENQFDFNHDLYKNYKDVREFTLTYPFIPYQFSLISDVFKSFSDMKYVGDGVKNTERSILGITHFTTTKVSENDIGYFVPFDMFFNEMFKVNLSHNAAGLIDRAYRIDYVKENPFARRVSDVLFLITNINEVLRINFPATVENISLLLIKSLDDNKSQICDQTKGVLEKLTEQNIIQENNGVYRFMEEDEIEVANLINAVNVDPDERCRMLYDSIIAPLLDIRSKIEFHNNSFRVEIKVDDKVFSPSGDIIVKFVTYEITDIHQLSLSSMRNELNICLHEILNSNSGLKKEIFNYIKTTKYIGNNRMQATGTRLKTLTAFGDKKDNALKELKIKFEKILCEVKYILGNKIYEETNFLGQNAKTKFGNALNLHLSEYYNKLELSDGYAKTNRELNESIKNDSNILIKELTPAEEEVELKIKAAGDGISVLDIIKEFRKSPYGWNDFAVIDILIQLGKKGLRRYEWLSDVIDLNEFLDKAQNNTNLTYLTVHKEEGAPDNYQEFISDVNNQIFLKTMLASNTDYKGALNQFRENVTDIKNTVYKHEVTNAGAPYVIHFRDYILSLNEIISRRNDNELIQYVLSNKDIIKKLRDKYENAKTFTEEQSVKYNEIKKFTNKNQTNFGLIDTQYHEDIKILNDYFASDTEPWNKLHIIIDIYKKLKKTIEDKTKELQAKAISIYQEKYAQLEKKRKELKIDNDKVHYDSFEDIKNSIQKLDYILK